MKFIVSNKGMWFTLVMSFLLTGSVLYSEGLVTGKWKCVGKRVGEEDLPFVLDLKQAEETVTGTVTAQGDTFTISQGSIQGNKLEFVIPTSDNRYVLTAFIENSNMNGTWKNDKGRSGTWEGQRQPSGGN